MSPPGRPKGESPSAQREGDPTFPPGRPKGESPSAQREGDPTFPPGRPRGESPSAQREGDPTFPPGHPRGESPSAAREDRPARQPDHPEDAFPTVPRDLGTVTLKGRRKAKHLPSQPRAMAVQAGAAQPAMARGRSPARAPSAAAGPAPSNKMPLLPDGPIARSGPGRTKTLPLETNPSRADGLSDLVVRYATMPDIAILAQHDRWPRPTHWHNKVAAREVIVATDLGTLVGHARFEVLWTTLPFLSMIHIRHESRGRGISRRLLGFLLDELRLRGYAALLSSAQSDEPRSQGWHEHMGFRRNGVIESVARDGVHELVYRRPL
jgi:L-amino acid N-acyltransferase YncA